MDELIVNILLQIERNTSLSARMLGFELYDKVDPQDMLIALREWEKMRLVELDKIQTYIDELQSRNEELKAE